MGSKEKAIGRREAIGKISIIAFSGMVFPQVFLKNLDIYFNDHKKVQILSVGRGANNILNELVHSGGRTFRTISIYSDSRDNKDSLADLKIQIGKKTCNGFSCLADPEIGRKAAKEDAQRIYSVLNGSQVNIIIASLGGGTGTGAGPLIAKWSITSGADTFAVLIMPFEFEGKKRFYRALRGKKEFQRILKSVYVLYNRTFSKVRSFREEIILCNKMHGEYCRALVNKTRQRYI